jgi:glycogen synthase
MGKDKKMKILYISPQLGKGGAEDILVNLSNNFSKDNEVTLFLFLRYKEDKYNVSRLSEKVIIKSLFENTLSSSSIINKILKMILYVFSPLISIYLYMYLKMYKFDIIHINMTISSFYLPFFKLFSKFLLNKRTKFVETFHTNWHLLKRFNKIIFPISWSLVDHIIYEIGEHEINNIKKYSFAKNISFIPFGVPSKEKINDLVINNFCEKYINYDTTKIMTLMTISRLRFFEKRIDVMLEITKKLIDKEFKDFKFVICGDGEDRDKIEKTIIELGISDYVILTGYVDNPQQLVNISDIFIVAMVGNSTGIAGLQAGMASKPIVGIQTLDNYNSFDNSIFSSSSVDELANKIISLNESKNYKIYEEQVFNYVSKTFDISNFYKNYKNLYKKILNEN